ncbi:lactate utilization protein C [bacterium BMS3Abin05]|nr:lactate utilization protein C [bacterium BMS3Abin05]GBE27542.1 lactate utilization protein C [bacterium BMS3Bbin03]HDZ12800.1 hypothetical protein [Bacteroidota bacterium]
MKPSEMFDPKWVDRFVKAAEAAAATVERIGRSPEALKSALVQAAGETEPVLLAEPDFLPPELFAPFRELSNVITHPDDKQLASVRIGVTDAFAGIARTGSVCVSISKNLGGSVSLFAREHIAVLDARSIVPRPRDLFSNHYFQRERLPENFVLITGPSATADMGELVRGVHGPGRVHILLII